MMNSTTIIQLQQYLDGKDVAKLRASAEKATQIERKFINRAKRRWDELDKFLESYILEHGKIPSEKDFDFESLMVELAYSTGAEAIKIAESDNDFKKATSKATKMAKKGSKKKVSKRSVPKDRLPTKLPDLMAEWDAIKKGKKKIPERQKRDAQAIQKEYFKKIKETWGLFSQPFRSGSVQQKQEIIDKVKKAARTSFARAKTIVETETTYYYNQVRRDFYDSSPDVTHYLFVSIRDMATTKWCKTRNGVVYEKGSKFLDQETPPCHWNCRSEMLPLTKQNPRHLALINNPSIQRKNRRPEPLPPGWNAA